MSKRTPSTKKVEIQHKEILIEETPGEIRVAVIEHGKLTEYFEELVSGEGFLGNIYKGKVKKVLSGMDSAFIDIGIEREGFFYEGGNHSMIDVDSGKSITKKKRLREGQIVLVQIAKESLGSKGVRLTTEVAIPSPYLIFMPGNNRIGVSKKISSPEVRKRLRESLQAVNGKISGGFIIRTSAQNLTPSELEEEATRLNEEWKSVIKSARKVKAPSLVRREGDLIERTIREIYLRGEGIIISSSRKIIDRCRHLLKQAGIHPAQRVILWRKKTPVFEHYKVNDALFAALRQKVYLKSGGFIVINQTEALVSVDVNSGRYTTGKNLEDTAYNINMEAVEEIARQIRLRGLGGIIVIDFIDMNQQSHRDNVLTRFKEELMKDRASSKVLSISEFGLVEMTRKRTQRPIDRHLLINCPHCEGRGRIESPKIIGLKIRDAIQHVAINPDTKGLIVKVEPSVKDFIENYSYLKDIEKEIGITITVSQDPIMPHGRFDISYDYPAFSGQGKKGKRRRGKRGRAPVQPSENKSEMNP